MIIQKTMSLGVFRSFVSASLVLFLLSISSLWAQVQVQGATWMEAENDSNNRLHVLVLNAENPASITLRFPITGTGKLFRYTEKAIDAVEVSEATLVDGMWQLSNPQLDCGYFVANTRALPEYYWIVNYSLHKLPQAALTATHHPSDPCQRVLLSLAAPIPQINYFLPVGVPRELKRAIKISYQSLEWIESERTFRERAMTDLVEISDRSDLAVTSSLIDASYSLMGDRFTEGLQLSFAPIESNQLESKRIELHAYVDPVSDGDTANSQPIEPGQLVSAPYRVELKAYANEPVVAQYLWRVYRSQEGPEFSLLTFNGSNTEFTFTEAGRYSLLLQASNRDASCSDERNFDNYLEVSESMLEVPNAFSPGSSEGVNDIFKVKYKSLVRFEARVFSSWGQELFRWSNPDEGWDGRFRGKAMPTGVYYYVINAEGADGIKYQRKGDINILRPVHDNTDQNNLNPPRY